MVLTFCCSHCCHFPLAFTSGHGSIEWHLRDSLNVWQQTNFSLIIRINPITPHSDMRNLKMCSLLFKVNGSIMFPGGNILSLVTKISSSEDFKVFRIGNKHSVTGLLDNSERSTFLPLILRAMYSVCGGDTTI